MQIGERSSPTFSDPLELLSDCHRRVERFLGDLLLVSERRRGGELTPVEREGLQTALRYFKEAAPKHTADEEESLFPRMRKEGSELAKEALEKIDRLEADHEVAEVSHNRVDELGRKWLADGKLEPHEAAEMQDHLAKLRGIYGNHIKTEDEEIFPLAKKIMDKKNLADVGQEMAARRGQPFRARI